MNILEVKQVRILVADDESAMLKLFRTVLSPESTDPKPTSKIDELEGKLFGESISNTSVLSFDLVTCQQGDEAVDNVKKSLEENRPFAVAFLDVRMPPGSDGVWTAEQIRGLDPSIEIVIVTGFSDISPKDIARRVQPSHKLLYINKPFHIHEIFQFASALGSKWLVERELHNTHHELETRIEERTRELANVNQKLLIDIERRKIMESALSKSEEKYRNIVQNISDFICVYDTDGNILETNLHFKNSLGYSYDDVIGLNIQDLLPAKDRYRFKDNIKLVMENGRDEGTMKLIAKDGHQVIIEYRNKLVRGKSGAVEIHGSGRDITERLRADQTLKESETRYRMLFEKAGDAIFIIDTGDGTLGEIVSANQAAADMHGYTMDELLALNIQDLDVPEDAEKVAERTNAMLNGEWISTEIYHRRKDGTIFPVALSAGLLELGKKKYILAFDRDITETKKLEGQLQHAQKMDAIGTLAGGIAHDFNNILAAIIGYTEISILEAPKESQIPKKLERVLQASQRAKDLVNQILTFSRQKEQDKKPVQIRLIANEALNLLRASIPSTIRFKKNIRKDTGLIQADPTQIHQVFMNLCTNAAYAMQEKGGVMEVSLSNIDLNSESKVHYTELKAGPYVQLTVKDTGCGIDKNMLDKLFDPFFTTKKSGEGTGLGLSTVHGIIKSMDGDIIVDSYLGKGSTFTVYIPRIDADRIQEPKPVPILPGGKEKILLVDDEEYVLDMTCEILEKLGYHAEARSSSIEALKAFRSKADHYDIVISDQTMPNMTGVELATEILKIRPDIPFILCTGFSQQLTRKKIKSIGIRALVMKPVLIKELAKIIRNVLDGNKDQ